MSAVSLHPVITSLDRFGLTLCLAIIFHALIILGVTFAPEDIVPPRYETMEIILVQQKEKETPEEAEFLSQANLEGGGETEEKVSPATPVPAPFPEQTPEMTAAASTEELPVEPTTTPAVEETIIEEQVAATSEDPEMLLAENSDLKEAYVEPVNDDTTEIAEPTESEPQVEPKPEPVKQAPPEVKPIPKRETPSAASLLTNSFKIASLSAEIRRKMESKAQRPKRKFISASTQEFKYAAYMEAWRAKVERVGNLNYPDDARRNRLSGSLILDVALNPDGSINEIIVRKPSGHKILDDAAIRIVELAAPYTAFPDNFRDEVDILHITRTWRFINNKGFK